MKFERVSIRAVAAAAFGAVALLPTGVAAQAYDTVISNGTIVDGSGAAAYQGDVAIKDSYIVAVGDIDEANAANVIDARGMMVTPGFVNIHSHAQPDAVATAVNMLTQGVTTEITNADGHGTTDIRKQLAGFAENGLAENVGLYIGFNAAWAEVVGEDDRRATDAEVQTMRTLIEGNLESGAWGVASGLDYKPAYFADADQVVDIVSVAGKWRTNFPNHDRIRPEEGYSSFKGMTETIAIAEQAGLTPVITHMKTQGAEQGNTPAVLDMLRQANAGDKYAATDIYPYTAGLSGLSSLNVPGWALAGGREAMLQRFADPETRARIIEEVERAMAQRFDGPGGVYLFQMGRELTDVIDEMNVRPGEAVLRLLEDQEHAAILRFGKDEDVIDFMQYENSAMACDCGASLEKKGHPRGWGSFPRVLGHYVRDEKALSMEDAIRKMTALPATIIGMTERGYLAPGMRADVTVFDPNTIIDHATYEDPTKPSVGIRDVFVNGALALSNGEATGAQGGEVVLRSEHMPTRPMNAYTDERSLSGGGSVTSGGEGFEITMDIRQDGNSRYATGSLRLVDGSGEVWSPYQLGVLQTADQWSSLTAIISNPDGDLRRVTITTDGGADGAAAPQLLIEEDDWGTLSGRWMPGAQQM
jgi:N-acyl-D-aspartate/D-glutamate deacylase|tara:strand:- start:15199 stop:17130 length:1932 start_codon:yes stop_codon:yes gene_type:complete